MIKRALLLVFVAALLGCGDDESAESSRPTTSPATQTVATPGAPAAVRDGRQARIEDNYENIDIKIAAQDPAPFQDRAAQIVGPVWNFTAGGKDHHAFKLPIKIELPYDPALVPAGKRIGISVWENRRWKHVQGAVSNSLTKTVTAEVDHFSTFAPTAYEEGIHVVGRWYGSAVRTQVIPGYEPTERTWGKTGFTTTDRFKFVFREESHDRLSFTRTIAESASWNVTMGESWWTGGPTGRMLAHPGLSVGRAHAEGELNGPMSPEDKQRLAEVEATIATLRTDVARLQTEYVGASDIERARIENDYESAKVDLDSAEASAIAIRFEPRPVFAAPHFRRFKDPNTNLETWTVFCAFDGHATHYDFVSYSVSGIHHTPVTHTPGTVPRALSLRTPDITAPPSGPFRKAFSESGHDDKEVHEFFGTSQPHTTDREITLKGRVVHRVRVPKNDRDANVIVAATEWDEERVIAPGGTVRVGAWLTEPGAARPPEGPPDHVVTTADDGTFALPMLLLPGKSIILEASWTNAEAQLTERQWASIPTDPMLGATVAEGAEFPITEGIARSGVATVRYAMATKELDLGADTRGGVLRRKDGALELALENANAILLGSFVMRVPHINQNIKDIPVAADVPGLTKLALLSHCTTPEQYQDVEARLVADAASGVTPVSFPGYVVCAPTCCTMGLRALGFTVDENTLPQEVYNYWKENDGLPLAPPWVFPFKFEPGLLADYLEAYQQFNSDPNVHTFLRLSLHAELLSGGTFDRLWPYVPATKYSQKEWLTTVRQSNHRPWQVAATLEAALEAKFAGQLAITFASDDVFASAAWPKVLNRLGAGCPAMVSIDHTSRGRSGGQLRAEIGGHFLTLVGAITNVKGEIVRLIFNDPYGDLTQRPQAVGYYDPDWYTGGEDTDSDVDKKGHAGAYAPYSHPDVNAYDGRIYSKYWLVLKRTDQPATPAVVRGRLLPSE